MRDSWFFRLAAFATVLTFGLVVLGAYVRLSDAGLGCPDWPGCYGHWKVPAQADNLSAANEAYPGRQVEPAKAWKEMAHRYVAGTLGLLVLALAMLAWRRRRIPGQLVLLPVLLLMLIIFQSLLGMLTVTWLLKPLIVMGHLLGGMATLALLAWITLRTGALGVGRDASSIGGPWRWLAFGALTVLVIQIALGGWTSSNYAALACPDFPTCHGQWWPAADFDEGFILWRGIGIDYEGGVLDNYGRVAIHLAHRLGAAITFLTIGSFALALILVPPRPVLRQAGAVLLGALLLQVSLGVATVMGHLPLPVAAAHNAGAALLLLAMIWVIHLMTGAPPAGQRHVV
ncbi:MAG TPA: COX15/CtaA family protein [Candidatus Acidoferrales bacterium]|nr:COX15/CtaA family protein [Candidatus Acidoferrales bacterium]